MAMTLDEKIAPMYHEVRSREATAISSGGVCS
jgi:hypothetical protein